MVLVLLGLAIGLTGASGSRVLGTLLFEVSPLDPVTYVTVARL
jgi:hypothetical protein